jgi:LacI family transcriptional regulator
MSITIRDVALRAGVSPATVSRVFNQSSLVRDETRAHVLRVASELRYFPNATARSLSLNKTQSLGVIIPVLHTEFFTEVLRAIDKTAQQSHYNLLVSGSHHSTRATRTALRGMSGRVDGLLVLSPNLTPEAIAEEIPPDTPVVFVHTTGIDGVNDSFRIANVEGATHAMEHLIELGHRRIAIIRGLEGNRDANERWQGYRTALEAAGIPINPIYELPGTFTRDSGHDAASVILTMDPRPTAVFASNDYMAIGAMSAFYTAGLRIPEDIAVVGFDDVPSACFASPPLTTIRVPIFELGSRALLRLVDLVEGRNGSTHHDEVLPVQLIVRESTAGSH